MSFKSLTAVINVGRIALRMTESDVPILSGQVTGAIDHMPLAWAV